MIELIMVISNENNNTFVDRREVLVFSQRKLWESKLRKTDKAEKETKVLNSEDLKIM